MRLTSRSSRGLCRRAPSPPASSAQSAAFDGGERHEGRLQHRELRQRRRAGDHELRHEGDEEHDALRVERGHRIGVPEHPPRAARPGASPSTAAARRRAPPQPDAEPHEIGRAGELERGEQRGRGRQHRARAEQRDRHRGEVAERHARHRRRARCAGRRRSRSSPRASRSARGSRAARHWRARTRAIARETSASDPPVTARGEPARAPPVLSSP